MDVTTWGSSLPRLSQRQTWRLSGSVVETVVLWGISLLPHGRQWEDRLKSDPLHLRVWRLAVVVHLALLSKMNVWSTAWENAECVKCGHVWAMWRLQSSRSKSALEIQKRRHLRCILHCIFGIKVKIYKDPYYAAQSTTSIHSTKRHTEGREEIRQGSISLETVALLQQNWTVTAV